MVETFQAINMYVVEVKNQKKWGVTMLIFFLRGLKVQAFYNGKDRDLEN